MPVSDAFERIEIEANGLRFPALALGSGPLALCAHGFPETATTFDQTLLHLAKAGYRAVAPWMRGYWPGPIAGVSTFHVNAVGADLVAIAGQLSPGTPCVLIGHDWGADAAYRAAALRPEQFSRLITIGIPHLSMIRIRPAIIWGLRHFATFQWKSRTLKKFRARDGAFVDEICQRWSPTWRFGPEETAAVKEAFAHEGCLEGAVAYYWDFVRPTSENRRLAARLDRTPIQVPTTMVLGTADAALRPHHLRERPDMFPKGVRVGWVPDVGHFVHREDFPSFARELDTALR